MIESIVNSLKQFFSPEIITSIIAALPVVELRLAIPFAVTKWSFSIYKAFYLSVLGNMIPVVPLLLFLEPISEKLRKFTLFRNFFNWLFERTRKRARLMERYEIIGLMLLVAIPLPMTGAWTGCVAASLFKIRFKMALLAITCGVLIAGMIVSIFTVLGVNLANG